MGGQGDETKPPIFLALQGGGAKGIVHIGAVNAIYDLDFAIQGVAGTSAGSIVAALVAAGYKPQEILNLDGEGNLFESFPPELGMRKPTDLFPPNGWRALKALRGFGRFIQSVVKRFSKEPRDRDSSHRPPTAQGSASAKGNAWAQSNASAHNSASVLGRAGLFLKTVTQACRKYQNRCRCVIAST